MIHPINFDYKPKELPSRLNNPFSHALPGIAIKSATAFQNILAQFPAPINNERGKMYGILVVKNRKSQQVGYIAAGSGVTFDEDLKKILVPSIFDTGNRYTYIATGFSRIKKVNDQIEKLKKSENLEKDSEIKDLVSLRKQLSSDLQDWIFGQYEFMNFNQKSQKLKPIFKNYNNSTPPAGAGDCAAPKLLHYAFTHNLAPIAIAEFWWGPSTPAKGRVHKRFYPACEDKCRPILNYMLGV